MTWNSEAERTSGGRPVAALKIELFTGAGTSYNLYLSDVGHSDADIMWDGRIIEARTKRAVNIQTNEIVSPEATVTFEDADKSIATMLDTNNSEIQGKVATLYSKFIADDGTIYTRLVARGIVEIRSQTAVTTTIALRPLTIEKMGLLQRQVDNSLFLNAEPEAVGEALPIVIGNVATAGATAKKILPIRCPMIDETPNSEKCVIHQGYGGRFNTGSLLLDHNGTITDLGAAGAGNWTLNEVQLDADNNRYAEATLLGAAGYVDGDVLYMDDWMGIHNRGTVSYVTLDGVNDYWKLSAADRITFGSRLDFGTDNGPYALTIEIKFRTTDLGVNQTFSSIYDSTSGNKRSWVLYFEQATNEVRLIISENGAAMKNYFASTTNIAANTDYVVRVAIELGVDVKMWINGVAQVLGGGGGTPYSSLFDGNAADVDFMIGATDTGGGVRTLWKGRIYYMLVARGAQDLASGTTDDRDSPLEDMISEWGFLQSIGDDYSGPSNLTPVSLGAPDYTAVANSSERTPIWNVDRLLRWNPYIHLAPEFVDRASFGTLAAEQEADDWDDIATKLFAGVAPWQDGSPLIRPPTTALSEVLKSQDAVLFENSEGKIAVASADIKNAISTADEHITQDDITQADIRIVRRPFNLMNHARYALKHNNKGGPELFKLADDLTSQEAYSLRTEDTEIDLFFIRNDTLAEDIINRQMIRLAGNPIQVEFDLCGLWGARINPADTIAITHPHMGASGWTDKQFYVLSVAPDFIAGTVAITAISRGDVHGPISYAFVSETKSITLTAELDTYIFEDEPGTAYGGDTLMIHGRTAGVGWKWRMMMRFDVSDIAAAGGTIISASLQLRTIHHWYPMSIWLRQLNSTTWNNASTWNAFDGGGGWNEAYMLGTNLSDLIATYPLDYHTFTFTAAGVAYLDGRVGADNKVQLTDHAGQAPLSASGFATREHGTANYRPQLTIIYTT